MVRTTLTLDDDVAVMVEQRRKATGDSLKDVVNEALRQGLRELAAPPRRRSEFRTQAVDLGHCLPGSVDNVAEALAVAEGDSFR
jgi:hypothetical protein